MPFSILPSGLLRTASDILTTSGLVLAAASSLSEHTDVLLAGFGLLLAVVGFWFRSWLAKREAFESTTRDQLTAQRLLVTKLQQESKDLMRDFAEEVRQRRRESERVEAFRLWQVSTLSAIASHIGVTPAPLPNHRDYHEDSGPVPVLRLGTVGAPELSSPELPDVEVEE